MRPRLFGMITTEASTDYTVEALRTFFLYTSLEKEDNLVLIDNDGAWTDKNPFPHPLVEVVRNPAPAGFAANSNYFLKRALDRGTDAFVLNNDLVFTKDWNIPLEQTGLSIGCPLSNREVQYVFAIQVAKTGSNSKTFVSPLEMSLQQYRGNEFAVQAVAEAHRANTPPGVLPTLVLPYFCVRIPLEIISAVGLFDEEFGRGGGEDYDYSLRAWLAGFQSNYALQSWIVHFYGKSSWSGQETSLQRSERERHLIGYFEKKWGAILREIIFSEKAELFLAHGFSIPKTIPEFAHTIKALREKGLAK